MQILKARFHSREDFDEAYSSDLPCGGLFVPTTTPLHSGDQVVVEIFCKGLPNKVMLRSEVKSWRPALPRLRIRAGALVAFLPEEKDKSTFMLAALDGAVVARKRRHTRLPVSVPVQYRTEGSLESNPGEMVEVSLGGALLRTERAMPPLGSDVVIDVLLAALSLNAFGVAPHATHTIGAWAELVTSLLSIGGAPTESWAPLRNAGQWSIGASLGLYFTPQVVALAGGAA